MNANPMSTPGPWTLVADAYAAATKPLLEQYCHAALAAAGFGGGGSALDVACGPGTLSLLIKDDVAEVHSIDFSEGMLDCLNREIARMGIPNIRTYLMDGQNLKFGENSFDWAFSMFGLMFFPDRERGFREILRTLKPGGAAAITSWAPVSESTLMQTMVGALQAASDGEPTRDSTPPMPPLTDPDLFRSEMEGAGFTNVTITAADGTWPAGEPEDLLTWIVEANAPFALMKSQMHEDEWQAKQKRMLDYLRTQLASMPTTLSSRAWIGAGNKP